MMSKGGEEGTGGGGGGYPFQQGKFGLRLPNKREEPVKDAKLFIQTEKVIKTRFQENNKPNTTFRSLDEKVIQKALKDDPNIFDYDAVYEQESSEACNKRVLKEARSPINEKPKYMEKILAIAAQRRVERDADRLRAQQSKLDKGKDELSFTTSSYKKKLDAQRERESAFNIKEEDHATKDDIKPYDKDRFYRNLSLQSSLNTRSNRTEPSKHISSLSNSSRQAQTRSRSQSPDNKKD